MSQYWSWDLEMMSHLRLYLRLDRASLHLPAAWVSDDRIHAHIRQCSTIYLPPGRLWRHHQSRHLPIKGPAAAWSCRLPAWSCRLSAAERSSLPVAVWKEERADTSDTSDSSYTSRKVKECDEAAGAGGQLPIWPRKPGPRRLRGGDRQGGHSGHSLLAGRAPGADIVPAAAPVAEDGGRGLLPLEEAGGGAQAVEGPQDHRQAGQPDRHARGDGLREVTLAWPQPYI